MRNLHLFYLSYFLNHINTKKYLIFECDTNVGKKVVLFSLLVSNICTVPNLTFTFVIIRKGAKNTTFRGHVGRGGGGI